MKKKIALWGMLVLFIGCNRSPRENNETGDTKEEKTALPSENSADYNSQGVIWKYSWNQQTETFEILQTRPVNNDTLTGEGLEKITNSSWPEIQIKFTGTSNDTAFISIPESEVLTQQMGSAGAQGFMISTTWSFTELKGIKYVAFDFAYGDHAMPGVYNRNSWEKNKN